MLGYTAKEVAGGIKGFNQLTMTEKDYTRAFEY